MEEQKNNRGRREFVKKAVYVAPAVLTLSVAPRYAKAGSEKPERWPAPPQSDDPTSWWAWLLKLLGLA